MRERIMKEPMDESQLVELREFIKKSKEVTIFMLGAQLTEVEQHYELMDEYSYQYEQKEFEACMF